eukprot:Skav213898  [mRNA]  locus=scaffold1439:17553:19421:+ [translate_table: standard]
MPLLESGKYFLGLALDVRTGRLLLMNICRPKLGGGVAEVRWSSASGDLGPGVLQRPGRIFTGAGAAERNQAFRQRESDEVLDKLRREQGFSVCVNGKKELSRSKGLAVRCTDRMDWEGQ